MAAVSQPGSRAGLITALVIFVVLFFIAAIFAVIKSVDDAEKERKLSDLQRRYREVVTDVEMSGPELAAVRELRNSEAYSNRSVFDILMQQRNDLTKLISGQSREAGEAIEAATATIDAGNKRLAKAGTQIPGGSLAGAISAMTDSLLQKQAQVDQLAGQVAAAQEDMKKQVASYQTELGEHRKSVDAANAQAAQTVAQTVAYRQSKDEQVARLEKDHIDSIDKGRKSTDDLSAQLMKQGEEIKKLQAERERLLAMVQMYRPANLADSVIRRPDGRIVQISRNNIVYINLGQGKQISPGMTFQIYDRYEGVPRTGQGAQADQLPAGKGSLEVIRVGADTSECRIIKLAPGADVVDGDLVANLVYDPNVKLRFKVFGEFDADQDGKATVAEAEIIKRLIVQWGGSLTEDVNVDTDFVVLGKEPVLPSFTAEELRDNPIAQFQMDKANKELAAYDEVRDGATKLHIPVLNQNRFLYLIGFFDQARK